MPTVCPHCEQEHKEHQPACHKVARDRVRATREKDIRKQRNDPIQRIKEALQEK